MAEKYSFFTDIEYTVFDWADYFASFIGNGVFPNPSTNLQVISNNNMTVTVKSGKAWINGYFYHNKSDLILSIDNADGVLKRRDSIVVRFDNMGNKITTKVIKGTFSQNPVIPPITRTADFYDLKIADIHINAGDILIAQANISDTRLDKNVCGIVTQTVKTIDTTTLYNQIQTDLLNFKTNEQTAFKEWFKSIQDVLDENTASNLLNLINKLEMQKADKTYVDNVVNSCVKTQAVKSGTSVLSPTLTTGNWFGTFKDLPAEFFPDGQAFLKTEVYAGDEAVLGWRKLTACCPHHDLTMEAVCINSVWQPWHKIYTSSRIRFGTGGPSGGFNGDIYIKHT